MIYKSYIVENNEQIFTCKSFLFYGENLGLLKYFKEKIKKHFQETEILNFFQEEVLRDKKKFNIEFNNGSLFEKSKIYLISNADDKILEILNELTQDTSNKIYLFSNVLDKKSNLRNFYEKSKEDGIVACYPDNDKTIKNLILKELKDFEGLNAINLNLIADNCSLDRIKLYNELEKIKAFFDQKKIDTEKLELLLNIKTMDDFNYLKDQALIGNKEKINKLLSETILDEEKNIYYISLINQRLKRIIELKQIIKNTKQSVDVAIQQLKPPIFWKDKENFLIQANNYNLNDLDKILKMTYNLELKIKSNSNINKNTLFKKLLLDICELSNSS